MAGEPGIIFMGTPPFAACTLKALHGCGFGRVLAVVTAPDKPSGRGLKLTPPAVKLVASELGIPVLQPANLKDSDFIAELSSFRADLFVVVAFRMLPEVIWTMPSMGTFNLHASLLPHYRGAAPINWAIINGENKTGVTTFFIDREIDTGNVILQREVEILPSDNAGSLHDKLMMVGSNLVIETVELIASGNCQVKSQNELFAGINLKAAPKIYRSDCRLTWDEPAKRVHDKIRGLSPYPGAWTGMLLPGREAVEVKIFSAEIATDSLCLSPGQLRRVGNSQLLVGTADFPLAITSLQLPGKKVVPVHEYLKGCNLQAGTLFQ